MKCPECQNEMIQSQKGWLCLHCGHVEAASPHNVPLVPADEASPPKPAAAEVITELEIVAKPKITVAEETVPAVSEAVPASIIGHAASRTDATASVVPEPADDKPAAAEPAQTSAPIAVDTSVAAAPAKPTDDIAAAVQAAAEYAATAPAIVPVETTPVLLPESAVIENEPTATIAPALETAPAQAPPAPDAEQPAPNSKPPVSSNPANEPVAGTSLPTSETVSQPVPEKAVTTAPAPILEPAGSIATVPSPKSMDGIASKAKPAAATTTPLGAPAPTLGSAEKPPLVAETHPGQLSKMAVAAVIGLSVITVGGLGTAGYFFIVK